MICRKYGSTLKNTVFELFKNVLKQFKIIKYCTVSDYNKTIKFPNGSEIFAVGLDEETKLLSLEGVTDIFVEELFEVERDIFEQLDLRLRSNKPNCEIICAMNPINSSSWTYSYCELEEHESFLYRRSTYKDNKFLPEAYIKSLEALRKTNARKAAIYTDGIWQSNPEGLVYKNVEHIVEKDEEYVKDMINNLLKEKEVQVRVGLDKGWTDPTAVVLTLYKPSTNEMWVIDEYYQRGASLTEIEQGIERMNIKKIPIRCDSASPDVVAYLKSKGYNAMSATKGSGSVNAGIDFLQDMKIYVIDRYCPNTAAEFDNYLYLKDKKTGKYTDKTDHDFSHAMDALRYAYSDLYNKPNKVSLLDRRSLGL